MNLKQAREVLGLTDGSDERSVRRAYAKLAKTYRPDTHPEEFSRVRAAYDLVMESLSSAAHSSSTTGASAANAESNSTQSAFRKVEAGAYAQDRNAKAVSYVLMAEELGSVEEDVPNNNPLQHLERTLVQAIKELQPGDAAAESAVVDLMDQYLSASGRHSRALRDYVERFLIGTCLGDYYIPHAMRERAAELSGLGNAVVMEHRLKPWEREFLLRFDESEVLDGLLNQANSREHPAEMALVHDASYLKVFMHRLNSKHVKTINRWMQWLDETYGMDAGFVHETFRARWRKLQQVEPLTPFVICAFIVVMVFSGIALNALGAPLNQFFLLPQKNLVITAAGLAVLSWANFMLVILARPVYRAFQHRVMVYALAHFSKPLLFIEFLATVLLVWGSAFSGEVTQVWGTPVVMISGMVFLVLAFISRAGGWLERLPFSQIVLRAGIYYFLATIVFQLLGASSMANSLWLLLGLIVICLRSRPLMHWGEVDNNRGALKGVFAFRLQKTRYSTFGLRSFIAMVGGGTLVVLFVMNVILDTPLSLQLSSGITAMLLSCIALELALNGGIHSHTGHSSISHRRLVWIGIVVVLSLILSRLHHLVDVIPALQVCVACYLIYSAVRFLAAQKKAID